MGGKEITYGLERGIFGSRPYRVLTDPDTGEATKDYWLGDYSNGCWASESNLPLAPPIPERNEVIP